MRTGDSVLILYGLNARNRNKSNNDHDALIAVTALTRGMTLFTDDKDLAEELRAHDGEAISSDEFIG